MIEDKVLFGHEEEREGKEKISGYVTGTLFFLQDRKKEHAAEERGGKGKIKYSLLQISLMINVSMEAFLKAEEL